MDNKDMSVGELVLSFRKENGLTVKKFIKLLGGLGYLSPSFMSRMELNGEIHDPERICKIANVIGIPEKNVLDFVKLTKLKIYKAYLDRKYTEDLLLHRNQNT